MWDDEHYAFWDDEERPERVGLVDLGSNSSRFIVMNVDPNHAYHLFYQDKRAVRLSEGLQQGGTLTEAARERTLSAMHDFSHTASLLGVEHMLAVATAAMRTAKNGLAFRDEIESRTGIPLTIISGREEARLGYLGVVNTVPYNNFVLFDLGGASTEISLVRNRRQTEAVSLPIGALSLTEVFQANDRISTAARLAIKKEVRRNLAEVATVMNSGLPVVGIGGTVRNVAKIHQWKTNYPIPKLHQYEMSVDSVRKLTDMLCDRTFNERRKISGLSSERADIIGAGAILINTLLEFVAAERLIISGCGLREGLFHHYYAIHYRDGQQFPENMLQHSVDNYRATLPLKNDEQMEYINRMALDIYDGLQPLHQFPARYREWLETACRLHDTGMLINYYSHAKHSAYIIANAPIYGLTHREQAICALIAGFQDGISNKLTRFSNYVRLLDADDLDIVKRLSLILAIAKCFDRTYDQSIISLYIEFEPKRAILHCTARDPYDIPSIESALQQHISLFEKYYDMPVGICWD